MTCPECGKTLMACYKYPVNGYKHRIPGTVHVYKCLDCHNTIRCLEVTEERLFEYQAQWERIRQKHIKENASLKEKIRWLTMPSQMADSKINRIRQELIRLIERTF